MKTIEQLYNGFYLDEKCENTKISNCTTPLWVAPIKKVSKYEGLKIDYENFAFAEKNEEWEIEYFHWLKNFLWIENSDFPPIFIFDNHNHAITFRYNIVYSKKVIDVELIHIDQHSDCRDNENHLELSWKEYELEKVFHFWNKKCNVGNFIPPALEGWIVSSQIQIRSTTSLENLDINKSQNYILDIDLDFCLDWIGRNKVNKEAIQLLRKKFDKISKSALWITIATSPYFLDQELAVKIVEKLCNNFQFEYHS